MNVWKLFMSSEKLPQKLDDGTGINPNTFHYSLLDFRGPFLSNVFMHHGFDLKRQIRKTQPNGRY